MTEDEAKTKWCPYGRSPTTDDKGLIALGAPVTNRRTDGRIDAGSLCLGSACMAWRWIGFEFERCGTIETKQINPASEGLGDGWEWSEGQAGDWAWFRPLLARPGCCGLAGKPWA